jgi:hypothetical protein
MNTPVNQDYLLALIEGLEKKITIQIQSQKETVNIAMGAAEKAVQKAEAATEKRFEALNELRKMAEDWRIEFARQSTVDLQISGLSEKIETIREIISGLQSTLASNAARSSGRGDVWAWIVAAFAAGATAVEFWFKK